MKYEELSNDDLYELAKTLIGYEISGLSAEIYALEKNPSHTLDQMAALRQKKRELTWEREDLKPLDTPTLLNVVQKYGKAGQA